MTPNKCTSSQLVAFIDYYRLVFKTLGCVVLEERLADAAETVLAEQMGSESGDELLAPDKKDDDPIALGD